MKKRLFFLPLILLLCGNILKAQVSENFNDGDITSNPVWFISNSSDWIVNPSFQLQSNNTTASSNYYISTVSTLATNAQWEMYINLAFNTSSANYVDVYLTASVNNLMQNNLTGYFVRLGGTNDNISLYRKDGTSIQLLVAGINGILNHSNNVLKIKVTRDAANQWKLYRDTTGTGNNYFNEGSVIDATYITSSYFGISIQQSTVSFFKKHFFDDIIAQPYVPDVIPPVIQAATATSANSIAVLFNEPLDKISSEEVLNYMVNNGIGYPIIATRDSANTSLVHLTFSDSFKNGIDNKLTVNGVADIAGNAEMNDGANFTYYAPYVPQQYDIVIDEIMSDPTPQVGLPNNEWIEIKNVSSSPINLQGWKISDLTDTSGAMPGYTIQPDSFAIVCAAGSVAAMSVFGHVISVTNFPSLDNTGDELVLSDNAGNIIHAVNYSIDWFQNELKKEGGWSLEMIDTKNPCSGSGNWTGSIAQSGGTPGRKNSVDTINNDETAPKLLRAYATDSLNITLLFDEPLNNSTTSAINKYIISDGIGNPVKAIAVAPLFDKIDLQLTKPLQENKIYTVTINSITDCAGNIISLNSAVSVGLSAPADSLDIVINEILYNPKPNGVDYIELYNRSNKIIDLKHIYIANRNSTGVISSITALSTSGYLLFPEKFIVATANADIVKSQYITLNPDAFVNIANMPSYNDDNGDVIILNGQGNIIDELKYADSWQFPLITNTEGVALERIDYNSPTQSPDNWRSAATSAGYGTPTYQNSQYRVDTQVAGEINVSPAIFSPDNDGIDDFATVDYSFPQPGYVINITVFDASGRHIRYLEQNALCGTSGNYHWDGLGDGNKKLPVGIYIIYSEIFSLDGKTKQFKNTIVLARRD